MFRHILKRVLHPDVLIVCTALGVLFVGSLVLWFAFLDLPDPQGFEQRVVEQSTKIYDRTGEILLYDAHQDIQRTVVSYEDISRYIKNATIAIEDAEFYEHNGVRPLATLRALFLQPLRGQGIQGGSTITQQVVKNSLLTSDRKISRKLKEWALALKLEQARTKNEILTLYLNETPYGGNIYGVEEASQSFFGKSANDVTIAEAAYLAALPQAPTYYSPYGDHVDDLESRKNLVLKRMLDEGFITDEEFDEARAESVSFLSRPESSIRAPHFVFYVLEQLEKMYGARAIFEDGLRVTTTLDWRMQGIAERVVREHALSNEKNFDAENAGLVAVDPRTGGILVMVGSRDYFDENIEGNFNITTAHRQPGSSFKPIVYAAALEKGYTPDTVVFDLRTQFSTLCPPTDLSNTSPCYSPQNYDHVFRGPVTFRNALAQSINVPAVKVLYLVGIKNALNMARRLGIEGLEAGAEQFGLTLVLGGGEVTPLEMASAYATFANEGVRNEEFSILKVENSTGTVLEEHTDRQTEVLPANVARQISDMLSDNVARTPAFGADSYLYFGNRDVAVKTGTTNDYRDAWIIGYTPSIAAAAWAGNNDNSPMVKKVAGFIVAPMWRAFMDEALAELPVESFTPPLGTDSDAPPQLQGKWEGGTTIAIDTISGKRATENTPKETTEELVIGGVHSILHWVDKDNPRGGVPTNPADDPQYTRWEYPVQLWARQHGYTGTSVDIPTESDDIHIPKNFPKLSIKGLNDKETFSASETVTVRVEGSGTYDLAGVELYINERYIETDERDPFIFSLNLSHKKELGLEDSNTLRVVGIDEVYNKSDESISFNIE